MTFAEYQKYSQNLHQRAKRVRDMILADARATCKAAGLDPGLLGIHPHNAMCGYNSGQPWAGVDYKLVRRCLWLCERSYIPERLASKVIDRAWKQLQAESHTSGYCAACHAEKCSR